MHSLLVVVAWLELRLNKRMSSLLVGGPVWFWILVASMRHGS